MAAVNAQASNVQCEVAALSSSEGSLYSACCQSGSDGETDAQLDQSDTYGLGFPHPSAGGASLPVASASWYNSSRSPAMRGGGIVMNKNHAPLPGSADKVYSTLQAAVRKIGPSEREVVKEMVPIMAQQHTPISKKQPSSSRQELRRRLQEVKLTSESGNASVIEVIEPSSSEDEDSPIRPPQGQSTPLRAGHARSFNASFSEELEKARQNKNRAAGPMQLDSPMSSKSADLLTKGLAEPDLLAGTVPSSSSRSCHDLALLESPEDDVNPSTRSHSSLSSSNNTAVTLVPRKKSGGFLTKFGLKARWPSKRKSASELTVDSAATDGMEDESQLNQEADEPPTSPAPSGVVAGLSQMFEDMSSASLSGKSSSATVIERRGSHSPSSRNSLATSTTSDPTTNQQQQQQQQQLLLQSQQMQGPQVGQDEEPMDLAPSTSPPPVPLEIETYNSMSPSSSQETSSNTSCSASHAPSMPPPPPPRCSELTKTTPSSSASSSTSASHGGVESLSVAASEDSGIVMARPTSSASKSDSSPRPAASGACIGNSTYSFATFSPLRCKASSGPLDTSAGERLSPAPSDVSKAESASASDLSKTESMRHFRQLACIEETATTATVASSNDEQKPPPPPPVTQDAMKPTADMVEITAHQSGQILTWREAKLKNQVVTPPPLEERLNKVLSLLIAAQSVFR